jgi:hypothetical protein
MSEPSKPLVNKASSISRMAMVMPNDPLAQRRDLSEADVNQIIDDIQYTLRSIAKAPRRLAIRTQEKVRDFQSAIADYLRSTDKAELSPTGIERDIELAQPQPLRASVSSFRCIWLSFAAKCCCGWRQS